MPTSASRQGILLLDTSVAVASVVEDHTAHPVVTDHLRSRRLGMAGHAYFETFSVLTRLPAPLRRPPAEITRLLETNFPESRFLGSDDTSGLADRLGELGIAGGSVYDALVGAAATRHGLPLATRDRRALDTYRVLDVDYRFIE